MKIILAASEAFAFLTSIVCGLAGDKLGAASAIGSAIYLRIYRKGLR